MPKIEYPECGKIVNTHGCHGGVKVEPWCDSPAVFAALPAVYFKKGDAFERVKIQSASVFRSVVCTKLAGVDTMDEADALRGTVLYAKREDLHLPEGAMLVAEMLGLPVYHQQSGEQLGVLKDIIHPGASDIYVIDTPKGDAMVPVVAEFVKRVDEQGIFLLPIEGMFA